MEKKLNFLYSSIHGAYWVYYGVISSFSSVFLLARGFSNSQIGIIIALANILAVIIQPYLADYVDRSGRTAIFSVMASILQEHRLFGVQHSSCSARIYGGFIHCRYYS